MSVNKLAVCVTVAVLVRSNSAKHFLNSVGVTLKSLDSSAIDPASFADPDFRMTQIHLAQKPCVSSEHLLSCSSVSHFKCSNLNHQSSFIRIRTQSLLLQNLKTQHRPHLPYS